MKKAYRFIIFMLLLHNLLVSYAFREPMTHGYYPDDEPHSRVSSDDITSFVNFILLIVVIVLIIKGIKKLIDYFTWRKREKDAAIYRAIQEEKTRREKESENLKEFLRELNQRIEQRESENKGNTGVNGFATTILNEDSTHRTESPQEDNITSKEKCKQSFLANQNILSYEYMNLDWEKKCRFLFSTATLSEDGKSKVATDCRIVCLYSYEYNKCSDITLRNGYTRVVELNTMNLKENDTVYDKYLLIIDQIKRLSNNNIVVLFPTPNKRNWKKFKLFHYSYFISELNKKGVYYTDNIEDSALSKEGIHIIIFSLNLKKNGIFELVPGLIAEHIATKPTFVYLTIYLETDKNGRPYLINSTKLPCNDF